MKGRGPDGLRPDLSRVFILAQLFLIRLYILYITGFFKFAVIYGKKNKITGQKY